MSGTALLAVQSAIVTLLRGTAAVTALVGQRVYDAVPQGTPFPYIAYDDAFEVPERTFGQDGRLSSFTLSVYTQDGSATSATSGAAGFKAALLIADAIVTALVNPTGAPLVSVTGYDVVDVDVDTIERVLEADGITRRVDIHGTATLEATS